MYDAETNEPAWVQSIAASNGTPDGAMATTPQAPQTPRDAFTNMPDPQIADCPQALTWYVRQNYTMYESLTESM